MACLVGAKMLSSGFLLMESEVSERSCITLTSYAEQKWCIEPNFSGRTTKVGIKSSPFLIKRYTSNLLDMYIIKGIFFMWIHDHNIVLQCSQ